MAWTRRTTMKTARNFTKLGGLLLLAAGSLAACAGADGSEGSSLEGDVGAAAGPAPFEQVGSGGASPGAKEEVLAEVQLAYGKVTFHRLDTPEGYTRLVMSELVPNTFGRT